MEDRDERQLVGGGGEGWALRWKGKPLQMAKEEVSVALSHFSMFSVKSPLGSPRECGKFEADVAGMRGADSTGSTSIPCL